MDTKYAMISSIHRAHYEGKVDFLFPAFLLLPSQASFNPAFFLSLLPLKGKYLRSVQIPSNSLLKGSGIFPLLGNVWLGLCEGRAVRNPGHKVAGLDQRPISQCFHLQSFQIMDCSDRLGGYIRELLGCFLIEKPRRLRGYFLKTELN